MTIGADLKGLVPLIDGNSATIDRLKEAMVDGEEVISADELPIVKKLGEGSFGIVYKCRYMPPPGSRCAKLVTDAGGVVAVKRLKTPAEMIANLREEGSMDALFDEDPHLFEDRIASIAQKVGGSAAPAESDEEDAALREFAQELLVLKRLEHPNVIGFIGVGLFQTATGHDSLALVQEFASGGSLKEMIHAQQASAKAFTVTQGLQWAIDVAEGMAFLHACTPPIVHRDLKPENILLCGPQRIAKIGDFGLAALERRKVLAREGQLALRKQSLVLQERKQSRGENDARDNAPSYKMTGRTGSLRYMAPENWRGEDYGLTVDQYSFGIICYELLIRGPAYRELYLSAESIAKRAAGPHHLRPTLPAAWPKQVTQVLEACWAPQPSARPPFEVVVDELKGFDEATLKKVAQGSKKGWMEAMGLKKAL